MKTLSITLAAFSVSISIIFAQGDLTPPPGPPAPTMKTLDQIDAKLEKRTPISSLPYFITNSGSYYVASNLTAVAGQSGITVMADDVTIDLNGFSLIGSNSFDGIFVLSAYKNFKACNGTIRNWSGGAITAFEVPDCRFERLQIIGNGMGVQAGNRCVVEGCSVVSNSFGSLSVRKNSAVKGCVSAFNGGAGIGVAESCTVTDCRTESNTGRGIFTFDQCIITGCIIRSNGFGGIAAGSDTLISDSTISRNTGNGIEAFSGARIQNCVISGNTLSGINVFMGMISGCTISDCTISQNQQYGISAMDNTMVSQCTVSGNTLYGMICGPGSTITRCTASNNGGNGIHADFNCTVENCMARFNGNNGIEVNGGTCRVLGNHCSNNGTTSSNGAGIRAEGMKNQIENNYVINNDLGIYCAPANANLIIRNSASGNTGTGTPSANYSVEFNYFAPIIDVSSQGFTNTIPQANLEF